MEFTPELLKSFDFPGNKELWKDIHSESVIKIISYVIVVVTSLVGNGLVTTVLLKKKSLRCITNLFILNLAISDLLVTCTSTWVHAIDDMTRFWILGPQFCKINVFMQATALVSSVLTMTAVAIERFFGIVTPFVFCTHQKVKSVFSIIAIWLIASSIGIPPAIFTKLHVREWKDFDEKWCAPAWPTDSEGVYGLTARGLYYIIVSVLLFALPLLVMTCAYTAIIIKLRSKQSQINEINNNSQKVKNSSRKRVVMMLIILLVVFTFCWLPFQISMLYYELTLHKVATNLTTSYLNFHYFARFMTAVNSACNPVIFVCFSQKIRNAIKRLFTRKSRAFRSPGSSRYGSIRSSTRRTWV